MKLSILNGIFFVNTVLCVVLAFTALLRRRQPLNLIIFEKLNCDKKISFFKQTIDTMFYNETAHILTRKLNKHS